MVVPGTEPSSTTRPVRSVMAAFRPLKPAPMEEEPQPAAKPLLAQKPKRTVTLGACVACAFSSSSSSSSSSSFATTSNRTQAENASQKCVSQPTLTLASEGLTSLVQWQPSHMQLLCSKRHPLRLRARAQREAIPGNEEKE